MLFDPGLDRNMKEDGSESSAAQANQILQMWALYLQ
jgi:hypothetical protein